MSGVAGLAAADGRPIDPARLTAMAEALAHRGRDGQSVWRDGSIGLVNTAFDVEPEARCGKSPYDNGRVVVTADARLDNRQDLAAALGCDASGTSDTQLIAAAYDRWGADCPSHLLGDFALALWDRRGRTLFCARDHFGVKPLYYYAGRDVFLFGSEIKAILSCGAAAFRPREQAIGEFLGEVGPPLGETFFDGIRILPSGHSLTVKNGRVELSKYWSLTFGAASPRASAVEDFVGLMDQAIRRRTRSAGQVGALLSGGLDSSSIVRVAAPRYVAERGQALPTLSAVFDETPQWSERSYIDAVVARGDVSPTFVALDGYAPFAALDEALNDQDAPFFAPGFGVTRALYARARAQGLDALLDGHGGDETISQGYGRMNDLARAGAWLTLWRQVERSSRIYGENAHRTFLLYYLHFGPLSGLARRLVHARRRLRATPDTRPGWARFIRPEFAKRIQLAEYQSSMARPRLQGSGDEHLGNLTSWIVAHAFEVLDHQAAGQGIDLRFPLWDKTFVEFCLNLPADLKLDQGWTRLILRQAMEGRLPPEVQWRQTKLDFRPHLALGMLKHHTALIEAVILQDRGQIGDYMNLEELAEAYRRLQSARENTPGEDLFGIYRAVVLSEWNRKHS